MLEVRRLRHDEWKLLREIRLEALTESPEAFCTPLAEASGYPDRVWKDRARMASLGSTSVTAIALDGTNPVGMGTGLLRPDISPDVVPIVSVYVSPSVRRHGVAAAMLSIIERWAIERRASQTSLWVVETNDAARTFYGAVGYRETTDRQQTASSGTWETRFVKRLTPSG